MHVRGSAQPRQPSAFPGSNSSMVETYARCSTCKQRISESSPWTMCANCEERVRMKPRADKSIERNHREKNTAPSTSFPSRCASCFVKIDGLLYPHEFPVCTSCRSRCLPPKTMVNSVAGAIPHPPRAEPHRLTLASPSLSTVRRECPRSRAVVPSSQASRLPSSGTFTPRRREYLSGDVALPHFNCRGEYIIPTDRQLQPLSKGRQVVPSQSSEHSHSQRRVRVCLRFGCNTILGHDYIGMVCKNCLARGHMPRVKYASLQPTHRSLLASHSMSPIPISTSGRTGRKDGRNISVLRASAPSQIPQDFALDELDLMYPNDPATVDADAQPTLEKTGERKTISSDANVDWIHKRAQQELSAPYMMLDVQPRTSSPDPSSPSIVKFLPRQSIGHSDAVTPDAQHTSFGLRPELLENQNRKGAPQSPNGGVSHAEGNGDDYGSAGTTSTVLPKQSSTSIEIDPQNVTSDKTTSAPGLPSNMLLHQEMIVDEMSKVEMKEDCSKEGMDEVISVHQMPSERDPIVQEDPSHIDFAGWDSDLTDLSLSSSGSGESGSDSEDDTDTNRTFSGVNIRIPPLSSVHTLSAGRQCAIKKCRKPLPDDYQWKLCELCRAHNREYQRERLKRQRQRIASMLASRDYKVVATSETEAEGDIGLSTTPESKEPTSGSNCVSSGQPEDKDSTRSLYDPLNPPPPGFRVCTIRFCKNFIPPIEEYRWKMCERCRIRTRIMAHKRRKMLYLPNNMSAPTKEGSDSSSDLESEEGVEEAPDQNHKRGKRKRSSTANTHCRRSTAEHGVCANGGCSTAVPISSDHKECEECRARDSRVVPSELPQADGNLAIRPVPPTPQIIGDKIMGNDTIDPLGNQSKKEHSRDKETCGVPSEQNGNILFQHIDALIETLQARLASFIEGQSYYLLFKHNGINNFNSAQPMVFRFDAEYSIVAEPTAVAESPHHQLEGVKEQVAKVVGMKFHPNGAFALKSGGILKRFGCLHELKLSLPQLAAKSDPGVQPSPMYTRKVAGEMEVTILPDRSHQSRPGQKIIVRFRLVG